MAATVWLYDIEVIYANFAMRLRCWLNRKIRKILEV